MDFMSFLGPLFGGMKDAFGYGMGALDILGKGANIYQMLQPLLSQPDKPQFPRMMDQMQLPPMPQPSAASAADPQALAKQQMLARRAMQERGVYSGGAVEDPNLSMLYSGNPQMLYQMMMGQNATSSAGPNPYTVGPYNSFNIYPEQGY